MKHTYVALLLDESGSMATLRNEAATTFNAMLSTVKDRSREEKQKTTVTIISFADRPRLLLEPTTAEKVGLLPLNEYRPCGNTALFDAVGLAVETLSLKAKTVARDAKKKLENSFLVLAITDGAENASLSVNSQRLKSMLNELQDTEEWTFAFNVPHGYATQLTNRGVSLDNIREWEVSARGIAGVAVANSAGLSNYFNSVANGQRATKNFFAKVTTDLSSVTKRDVYRQLTDLSDAYNLFAVKAEAKIRSFVETKTKTDYITGSTFYLLMKAEKVQPNKAILVRDKTTGKIWGGQEARNLIGLPDGDHAKVTPGNHSNYDIFVQSTSTNRILPRGTCILVAR